MTVAERVDIDAILATLPAYTPAHWTAPQLIRMLAEELRTQYARIDRAEIAYLHHHGELAAEDIMNALDEETQ